MFHDSWHRQETEALPPGTSGLQQHWDATYWRNRMTGYILQGPFEWKLDP